MKTVNVQRADLPSWRKGFLMNLQEQVELEGKRVLEVGCGDCEIAKLVAQLSNPMFVYAIDLGCPIWESEKLLSLRMDVNRLLFPNSYFDVVFSHNVLEHVQNLKQGWGEIKRVLRKNGVFYTHFAPLWTHSYGHHFYKETDDSFSCAFPPYAHLYLNEMQINQIINEQPRAERQNARNCFFGDVCNKLLPSDYRRILMSNDDFELEEYTEIKEHHHNRPIPEAVFEKHPTVPKGDFEISGITIKGRKLYDTANTTEYMKEVYRGYSKSISEALHTALMRKVRIVASLVYSRLFRKRIL
jgi:SAM-dependent methyltransferase